MPQPKKVNLPQRRKIPIRYRVEFELLDWLEGCDDGNDKPIPAATLKEFKMSLDVGGGWTYRHLKFDRLDKK